MIEIKGNLWDFYEPTGSLRDRALPPWIVITTNGYVKANGHAVMGRGVAIQAAQRFPQLPIYLGSKLALSGNHVYAFPKFRLISFPVKHSWRDEADLALIKRSVGELVRIADAMELGKVYLTRPGCGNGRLQWTTVRKVIEPKLDSRFVVVEYDPQV